MSDNYNDYFYNKDFLDNVYNLLKGEDNELKKSKVRKLISIVDGSDYQKFDDDEVLTFEEFSSIFQKIYENSHDPKQVFMEGFAFIDKRKFFKII